MLATCIEIIKPEYPYIIFTILNGLLFFGYVLHKVQKMTMEVVKSYLFVFFKAFVVTNIFHIVISILIGIWAGLTGLLFFVFDAVFLARIVLFITFLGLWFVALKYIGFFNVKQDTNKKYRLWFRYSFFIVLIAVRLLNKPIVVFDLAYILALFYILDFYIQQAFKKTEQYDQREMLIKASYVLIMFITCNFFLIDQFGCCNQGCKTKVVEQQCQKDCKGE